MLTSFTCSEVCLDQLITTNSDSLSLQQDTPAVNLLHLFETLVGREGGIVRYISRGFHEELMNTVTIGVGLDFTITQRRHLWTIRLIPSTCMYQCKTFSHVAVLAQHSHVQYSLARHNNQSIFFRETIFQ
jgi:hypothetical protein